MHIPAPLWKIVNINNRLDGVDLKSEPKPNEDGIFTVDMNPEQWATFEINMKKPITLAPLDSPAIGVPSKKGPKDNIHVHRQPSMSANLPLP